MKRSEAQALLGQQLVELWPDMPDAHRDAIRAGMSDAEREALAVLFEPPAAPQPQPEPIPKPARAAVPRLSAEDMAWLNETGELPKLKKRLQSKPVQSEQREPYVNFGKFSKVPVLGIYLFDIFKAALLLIGAVYIGLWLARAF